MKLERFFDDAAKARVAEAVKAAEARTSGQIVPVVVERSGSYWLIGFLSLFIPIYFVGLLVSAVVHGTGIERILLWAVLSGVLVALLGMVPGSLTPFGRRLLDPLFERRARWRALRAFREHRVHQTREENGVLLFASLHERKVVVLGDRAVHEKLGDEHWNRGVATLVAGIRAGDPAEAFCKAIADIGDEMAKAFPRETSTQPNEISDDLRVDR